MMRATSPPVLDGGSAQRRARPPLPEKLQSAKDWDQGALEAALTRAADKPSDAKSPVTLLRKRRDAAAELPSTYVRSHETFVSSTVDDNNDKDDDDDDDDDEATSTPRS
jgi:hypothetical protein